MSIVARLSNDLTVDIFHGDFCDDMGDDATSFCHGLAGYPASVKGHVKIPEELSGQDAVLEATLSDFRRPDDVILCVKVPIHVVEQQPISTLGRELQHYPHPQGITNIHTRSPSVTADLGKQK